MTEIEKALEVLDDLLYEDLESVSTEILDQVSSWANNVGLDIMRVFRSREVD